MRFFIVKKIYTNFLYHKYYFEIFLYTNISYQFFDYKITFVNSQLSHTNSKGYFIPNKYFSTLLLKIANFKIQILYRVPRTFLPHSKNRRFDRFQSTPSQSFCWSKHATFTKFVLHHVYRGNHK